MSLLGGILPARTLDVYDFFSKQAPTAKAQGTQAHNKTPQKQNIRICMGIYREFNKVAKVHLPYEVMSVCCFLTVSCPINAILASFGVLVSLLLLLRRRETRTTLKPFHSQECLKFKIQDGFQILFWKILKCKWYSVNVLLKRSPLNGQMLGFHPQTRKLESPECLHN